METPASTRRVTRSQTLAALNNIPISKKMEDSEKIVSKSRPRSTKQQQDRSALIDITNDSPIVGVATEGLETPSLAMTKQRTIRSRDKTPGSGEALLRCQVKTLLKNVEEEAELSKLSLESRPFLHVQGFVNSPIGLLAPTPANTPQFLNLSDNGSVTKKGMASPVIDEQLISQVVSDIFDGMMQESVDGEKNLTRSLLLDFSEKSETFSSSECSSVVTDQDQEVKCDCKQITSPDDDESSVWSIQVNASVYDEDDIVVEQKEDYNCDDNYEEKYGGFPEELCEDMSRIRINNEKVAAQFTGRHTRFLYDSDDDEIIEEQTE